MYLLYWKQERDKITIIVILHCVFYIYVQSHLCSALWRGPFTTHIRLLYPVMHAFTRASDTCSHAIDSMYLVFVLHLFCAFAILRSGSPLPMFMVSSYGLICGRYSCLYTLRRIHIYYHIFNANIGAQLETVISGYIKYIQNIYPIYTLFIPPIMQLFAFLKIAKSLFLQKTPLTYVNHMFDICYVCI